VEKAFDIMEKERGKSFDPELVDVFFSIKQEIITIRHTNTFDQKSAIVTLGKIFNPS
jgi:putative two-component system response regulator